MNDEEYELLDPEFAGESSGVSADAKYTVRFPIDSPRRELAA